MLASYLAVALSTTFGAEPGAAADPCQATAGHHGYTILLEPSGEFVHCRDGETTDTPPVSNEHLMLQLPPVDPSDPFRFRLVHPHKARGAARERLFGGQLEAVQHLEATLNDLLSSPQTVAGASEKPAAEAPALAPTPDDGKDHRHISQARVPAPLATDEAPALRDAELHRLQYLGIATPAFVAALHALGAQLPALEREAGEVGSACTAKGDSLPPGALHDAVATRCKSGGPGEALIKVVHAFQDQIAALAKARHAARDALYALPLKASAADQQTAALAATAALQEATAAADRLLDQVPQVAKAADQFIRDVSFLQVALSVPPAAIEGQRLHLGRFAAAGLFSSPVVYEVQVTREPSKLFAAAGSGGASAPTPSAAGTPGSEDSADTELVVDRFQPIAQRFFSLELALLYSTGLPDHPALSGRLGQQTLIAVPTQGFAGGVLASLEPLEFAYPEHEWAGILRFPVIVIPFTLDPLTNYFIGGGIGWTDVGSITVGAHIALTNVPAAGTPYGTVFTTSPIQLDHITQTGPFAAGLFVGASLDVLGIVHLFFSERQPIVRDVVTGADLSGK